MNVLVLFPLALSIFAAGGVICWPIARGIERRAIERDDFDLIPQTLPPWEREINGGYQGQHRWEDVNVIGSATQARRRAALKEPTEEFRLIVAANYRSGELAMLGRAGAS